MAKAKKNPMVGKEIAKWEELEGGYILITFEDGTTIIVKQLPQVVVDAIRIVNDSDGDDSDEEEEEDDEEEDDDEDEDEDGDELEIEVEDLMEMDFDEMEDLVDEHELDVDVDDFEDDEEGLRKAIAKVLGLKLPKAKSKKGKKK